MSSSDDVTTAIGTCDGYDRLMMAQTGRRRQQRHFDDQHHHNTQAQCGCGASQTHERSANAQTHTVVVEDSEQQKNYCKHNGSGGGCGGGGSGSGMFWCSSLRHKMAMTALVILTFLGHVALCTAQGNMRFVIEPQNKTVAEGSTVVFSCTIENRKGLATWTQGGFALGIGREMPAFPRYSMLGTEQGSSGEFNLQIQDTILEEDEGNYECQVNPSDNSRGMRSRKAYLTVVVPPERPVIVNGTTIPVVLNRPSRILCAANNGKPAPSITWHIDGERVTQNVTVLSVPHGRRINATGVLTLTASMEHTGKSVECQAYTQFMRSPYRTLATLDVQYPPNLTMSVNISSRSLRQHDFVRFQCFGLANPPVTSWKWYRDGTTIPNITSNTYIIPAITPDYNNVVISCEATNRVDATRLDKRLNVHYGPIITEITGVVGANIGQPADLTCKVDGNPTPSIIWRRRDRSPKSHHVLWTMNTYHIEQVTPGSFGWYVCTGAVQGFPDTSKEAMLIKNDRPNPRSEKEQMAVKGERGKVECLVKSIPKPRQIKWSKSGRDIDFSSSGRFSVVEEDMPYGVKNTLIIQSVQSGDFGFYNCTVTNDNGTSSDQIELKEKYSVPITYIIIGIIGGFAVIFVIVLVCVLYRRYKRDDQGSVLDNPDTTKTGSYTDTDSSSDKKRDKADSPSTLMGQFRQGYTKDVYRFSADYDDVPYKNGKGEGQEGRRKETQSLLSWATCRKWRQEQTKGNNNGYGFIEPYESYSDHPIYDGEYVHGGDDPIPSDRFDSLYSTSTGPGFNMSSFRGNNYDTTTPPPTMTRITPLHMNSSKLATDV